MELTRMTRKVGGASRKPTFVNCLLGTSVLTRVDSGEYHCLCMLAMTPRYFVCVPLSLQVPITRKMWLPLAPHLYYATHFLVAHHP